LYPINGTATTYEEWVGALDLATMWDFKGIRKASVEALSTFITSRNVVENILLAKKYRVKQWLQDGYLQLIQKREPGLDIDKLRSSKVDLLTIARLWSIYSTILENRCSKQSNRYCNYCDSYHCKHGEITTEITHADADPLITQVFADEFREMEDF